MQVIEKTEGISGFLSTFRKCVRGSKKITFIGCPGWCNPFASLLGYVLRDAKKEMVFVPNLQPEKARKIELTEYGMELSGPGDPKADTYVLLGGLAMPKMGTDVNRLKDMINELDNSGNKARIIGVCIGGVFQKAGWDRIIDFTYIIDAEMVTAIHGDSNLEATRKNTD